MDFARSVSIIIPCYNAEKWISETLESCVQQGEVVKEIIVVNDHSTDNSWKILKSWQHDFPALIKVFKNPKKGACAARNYGFEQSSGEYIQWLDADDLLGEFKIQTQIKILDPTKMHQMANCPYFLFKKHKDNIIKKVSLKSEGFVSPDEYLKMGLNQSLPILPHTWLMHRKHCKEVGKWDESLIKAQDKDYFIRAIIKSEGIIITNKVVVYYRNPNSTNLSTQKSKKAHQTVFEVLKKNENLMISYCSDDMMKKFCQLRYLKFAYRMFPEEKEISIASINRARKLGEIKKDVLTINKYLKIFALILPPMTFFNFNLKIKSIKQKIEKISNYLSFR